VKGSDSRLAAAVLSQDIERPANPLRSGRGNPSAGLRSGSLCRVKDHHLDVAVGEEERYDATSEGRDSVALRLSSMGC